MPLLQQPLRIVPWTVILLCVAMTCIITVSRIRSYNLEGSNLENAPVRVRVERDTADRRLRRYEAAVDALVNAAQRAGVPTQAVVMAVVSKFEALRDEELLRVQRVLVEQDSVLFGAGDLEPIATYSSHAEATNAMRRLLSVRIQVQLRSTGKAEAEGKPQRYSLLVRKTDVVKGREVLRSQPNPTTR